MKYIITHKQYQLLKEDEQEIIQLPSIDYFGGWDELQEYLKRKGYPLYSINGDLDLIGTPIESLGNLTSVEGYLDLYEIPIQSLGNLTSVGGNLDLARTSIKSLGNLTSVGTWLDLRNTPIESLGNLTSVGGWVNLEGTPLSIKITHEQIREKVDVKGEIYL